MREKEKPSKNFVRCRQEIDNLVLCKKEEPSKNFVRWRRERDTLLMLCKNLRNTVTPDKSSKPRTLPRLPSALGTAT